MSSFSPEPWQLVNISDRVLFHAELRRELSPGHPLHELPIGAVARRTDCDDILFQLEDDTDRVAVTHLTWRGQPEQDTDWPSVTFYPSLAVWFEEEVEN
jgi:hypothetical protein